MGSIPMQEMISPSVAGAVFMAAALLALVPLLAADWPLALLLIFLHSPGYMIHQVEEHTGDRFRSFVDRSADLVVRYGGSLSGEHGDGQSRAELLP